MAFNSFVLPVPEILGQHDQKLVDRYQETRQGPRRDLVGEIRKYIHHRLAR